MPCPKIIKKNATGTIHNLLPLPGPGFGRVGVLICLATSTLVISLRCLTFASKSPPMPFRINCILSSTFSISDGIISLICSFRRLATVGDLPLVEMAIFRFPFLTMEPR